MSGKVIRLDHYRSGITFGTLGVSFPWVYRLRGRYLEAVKGGFIVGEKEASPSYTLSELATHGLVEVRHTPILGFDPGIDSGWLIVRHHTSLDAITGYQDAKGDLSSVDEDNLNPTVFATREGLFTLLHRQAAPKCPDHLVIYMTKQPGEDGTVNVCKIVHPDGSVTSDENILSPPEEE